MFSQLCARKHTGLIIIDLVSAFDINEATLTGIFLVSVRVKVYHLCNCKQLFEQHLLGQY